MEKHASVDAYLARPRRWNAEMRHVRALLLDCGLGEAVKWGKPCFTHPAGNIAILQPMKDFLALLFFQGALLDDPDGLLEEQGENTRAARRLCFTSVEQVAALESSVRRLVGEAVAVAEEGRTLPPPPEQALADELQARLDADPALKAAFEGLTPGRQREYDLHVSGAKQSKTRAARVDKHVPRILAGKGLRDR